MSVDTTTLTLSAQESFGVLMQAAFSIAAASYFGRRATIAEPGAAPAAAPTGGAA